MKKNIIILALSVTTVLAVIYSYSQKQMADSNAEQSIMQEKLANRTMEKAEMQRLIAQRQTEKYLTARDSLEILKLEIDSLKRNCK